MLRRTLLLSFQTEDEQMKARLNAMRLGPRGLLATALVMAVLLVFMSYSAWRSTERGVQLMLIGQTEQLLESMRREVGSPSASGATPKLQQFLEKSAERGLRYVGIYGLDGSLITSVGKPLLEAPHVRAYAGQPKMEMREGKVRIWRRPSQPTPRRSQPGGAELARPGEPDGSRWQAGPPERSQFEGRPGRPGEAWGGRRPPPEGITPPAGEEGPPPPPPGADGSAPVHEGARPEGAELEGQELPPLPAWQDSEPRKADGGLSPQGERGKESARRPIVIVLDLEPAPLQAIERQALVLLLIGILSSVLLTLLALFFWRQVQRGQAMEAVLHEQRRLAVLGQMSAVLAHEIRNPLASLKGHAQLLEETMAEGSRERRSAGRVVAEAQRLEKLVHELLEFARTGKLDCEAVELQELLTDAASEVDRQRIRVSAPARLPPVWLDRDRMLQVLTNLLRNALQASPPNSHVELVVTPFEGTVAVEVLDRGVGIPAGEEERIFEPFRTHKTKGIGLGLAISRKLVEQHGGTLRAHARAGGGACFRIELPQGAGGQETMSQTLA